MSSPTVCIDCSPLLLRSAGVKTYLYHWLNAVRALSPETIRTFLAPGHMNELSHDGGPFMHPLRIAALLSLNRLPQFVCNLAAPRCDIFHVSNQLRKFPEAPRLSATIHDLTPWILPECHTSRMVAADQVFAERVLKRAAGVIAVSENTKLDAIRILGLSPDRIRVIHLGVPAAYFSVAPESVTAATGAYHLGRPYFLFVGTVEPRKNLDTLLTAWNSLPPSFREENELIIAGMPGWHSEATMRRILQASQDRCGVRYLGYVPEAHLPGLTAGALALVYPSLYEGFGIPVAQAMAAGCPVITSNLSSLPEVAGEAALLIDPRSVSELSSAMRRISDSDDLRAQLSAAGMRRSTRYRWEVVAAESLRYFASIA